MRTRAERIHYRQVEHARKRGLAKTWKIKTLWEDGKGLVKLKFFSPNRAWLKKQAAHKTRRYRRGLPQKGNSYKKVYEIRRCLSRPG